MSIRNQVNKILPVISLHRYCFDSSNGMACVPLALFAITQPGRHPSKVGDHCPTSTQGHEPSTQGHEPSRRSAKNFPSSNHQLPTSKSLRCHVSDADLTREPKSDAGFRPTDRGLSDFQTWELPCLCPIVRLTS